MGGRFVYERKMKIYMFIACKVMLITVNTLPFINNEQLNDVLLEIVDYGT